MNKKVVIGIVAAALIAALVLLLVQCHKDDEEPDQSATSSSASFSEIDPMEQEGVYFPEGADTGLRPGNNTPEIPTGTKIKTVIQWDDYVAEHPEAANVSHPQFYIDTTDWRLYAFHDHPVPGANDIDGTFKKAKVKCSKSEFSNRVGRETSATVYFNMSLRDSDDLEKIMATDWKNDFEPTVARYADRLGAETPIVRTYMKDGFGILFADTTINSHQSESSSRRFISAWIYIDYGDGNIFYVPVDQNAQYVRKDDLNTWGDNVLAMIDEYLSLYGLSLETTVYSENANDGIFDTAYVVPDKTGTDPNNPYGETFVLKPGEDIMDCINGGSGKPAAGAETTEPQA